MMIDTMTSIIDNKDLRFYKKLQLSFRYSKNYSSKNLKNEQKHYQILIHENYYSNICPKNCILNENLQKI